MRKLALVGVLVVGLMYFVLGGILSKNHAMKRLGQVVYSLVDETGRSGGTGFLVLGKSGTVFVMTNAHVCGKSSQMTYIDGTLTVVKVNKNYDLCLLVNNDIQSKVYTALVVEDTYSSLEEVYTGGFAHLERFNPQSGYFLEEAKIELAVPARKDGTCEDGTQAFRSFFGSFFCVVEIAAVKTTFRIFPGNSGSPVISSSGGLVGVLFSGSTVTHYGNAVPLRLIQNFMEGL